MKMKTSHITNEQRLLASALSPLDLFIPLGNYFSPVPQPVFINDKGVWCSVCSPLI